MKSSRQISGALSFVGSMSIRLMVFPAGSDGKVGKRYPLISLNLTAV
jgi:hypothetical protein